MKQWLTRFIIIIVILTFFLKNDIFTNPERLAKKSDYVVYCHVESKGDSFQFLIKEVWKSISAGQLTVGTRIEFNLPHDQTSETSKEAVVLLNVSKEKKITIESVFFVRNGRLLTFDITTAQLKELLTSL